MLSHAPTGVLTQFGHALRKPCGRIHWAGTESSSVMCGWVDGAVRSGGARRPGSHRTRRRAVARPRSVIDGARSTPADGNRVAGDPDAAR